MDYEILSKLYYQDRKRWEETYQTRYQSEYAVRLDFEIGGSTAFFLQTPDVIRMLTEILWKNAQAQKFMYRLPPKAVKYYRHESIVEEILTTNRVEGVQSTRKEIRETWAALSQNRKKRFYGLVQKYQMLITEETIPLKTSEDIRAIYEAGKKGESLSSLLNK